MKICYYQRWQQTVFYSHKWQEGNEVKHRRLQDHLLEVGKNAYSSLENIYFNDDKSYLIKTGLIVGCLHDFGKYTQYFQDYLETNKNVKYKSHAFISAFYAAYCAKMNNFPDEYILYIYLAIKHHHGNLCDLDSDIGVCYPPITLQKLSDNINIMKKQCDNIKGNLDNIKKDMQPIFDFTNSKGVNIDYIDKFIENPNFIFEYMVKLNKKIKYSSGIKLDFTDLLLIYSALIDNDKRNAASIKVLERKDDLNESLIENYRNSHFKRRSNIDIIRDEMYLSVKDNALNSDLSNHFYTITSPTGSGKTIAGLSAALILRQRLKSRTNKLFRIIYALPFTTIVDQNYDVTDKILSTLGQKFFTNHERYILKHHHLSILTQTVDGEEISVDQSLQLTEDWDSEIIFTTFVQLFNAFAGYKNKNLKKYFRIANSIIILDEIQSISVENWANIRFLLKIYAEKFNVYFIIMTATQPNLISTAIELSGDYRSRFLKLDRVVMFKDFQPKTPDQIIDSYINRTCKSMLFVFNTINTSISAYNYIKSKNINKNIFYISTNIIPLQRNVILNEIKDSIKDNKDIIVIATQIFEAGIDISFDIVVRDIAPIDSIIQASGRVNRNGSSKKGSIYIVNCCPINTNSNGYFSNLVYGKLHTDTTLKIMACQNSIAESNYLDLIKKYYNEIEQLNLDTSIKLENALKNLSFFNRDMYKRENGDYVSNFGIIQDLDKYISIFVEIDEKASQILEKYISKKIINKYDDKSNIELRREIYNYTISIRKANLKNLTCDPIYDDFYVIRNSYLKSSYDNCTGLKKNSDDIIVI